MKTEISTFCDEYLQVLQHFPESLMATVENLEKCPDDDVTKVPKAILNDVRARLKSLGDKLERQQAYLLIFGPLKSGKSTLMNAISRNYVSEVTSLPAYPCLVYVGHQEQQNFSVTRYNGRESMFSDGKVLQDIIADGHIALAAQIREAEDRGETFEPRSHFPEAIRRVDVRFPIENLRESNTILVDTPGLYSRMHFGYDLLTREFRDSAACAVFVVKTDNLFLEQVFNEFNELLGLFSRIFLVINVDSGKRDLQQDGTLLPSAESKDPGRIIDAFKTLSMAGPLRKAHEAGRVRIHAIDLLSAAASFLKTAEASGDDPESGESDPQLAAFAGFEMDLTNYLNSSDYTMAFMRDSLRQGQTLCGEAAAVGGSGEIETLRNRQEELEKQVAHADAQLEALDRLLSVNWSSTFENVQTLNAKRALELAESRKEDVLRNLREALERWYQGSQSFKALQDQHWAPVLVSAGRALSDESQSRVHSSVSNALGGSEPSEQVMSDLNLVGFTLVPSRNAALEQLKPAFDEKPFGISVQSSEIPVRKSFWDYLLFRRQATVRDRLFGEPESPDREIPPEIKSTRLSEKSREAFEEIIGRVTNGKFPELPAKDAERLMATYIDRFCRDLDDRLRSRLTDVMEERQALLKPYEVNRAILNSFSDLHRVTVETVEKIRRLEPSLPGPIAAAPKAAPTAAVGEV